MSALAPKDAFDVKRTRARSSRLESGLIYLEDAHLLGFDLLVDEDAEGGETFGLFEDVVGDAAEVGADDDLVAVSLEGLLDRVVEVAPRVDDEQVLVAHDEVQSRMNVEDFRSVFRLSLFSPVLG